MRIIKDCIINEYFIDSKDPIKERLKYCKKNCNFKCNNKKQYKKRQKNDNNKIIPLTKAQSVL